VSSLGCAAAWSLPALIVFRATQGIGGALLHAAALSILGGLSGSAAQGARLLSVLLVITFWGLEPIVGALVVSALPAATLVARPLARRLSRRDAVASGALLLAAGLVALALLPAVSNTYVAISLVFCGFGLGLAVPTLTQAAMHPEAAKL